VQAKNCRLSGSPLIENLHLDQRFCLSFVTTLTWSSAATSGQNGNGANASQLPEQYGKGHIQVSSLHAQDWLLCTDSMSSALQQRRQPELNTAVIVGLAISMQVLPLHLHMFSCRL